MRKSKRDWSHVILKHVFNNYTVFDVHLDDRFLIGKLRITKKNDGNFGRKLIRTLQELEKKGLLILRVSDHENNDDIEINQHPNDNESITIEKYWFHIRLTFDGLVYVGNYLRDKQQKNFTIISLIIAGLTAAFIGLSVYFDWRDAIGKELQKQSLIIKTQSLSLDSIRQTQRLIDHNLQEMIETDSANNHLAPNDSLRARH